ncbi:MAG TPA: POTRA domain-containing protein, partial [Chthoniobacteraceae bacterium]
MRRCTTRNHGQLGLIVLAGGLAILSLESAPAQPAQKFQPLPKDESLQPLPPSNKGRVQFVGNHAFTEDQLRQPLAEQIGDIQKQGLTKPRADDTAYYLAAYYRKEGYVDTDVRWDIRGSQLILTIKEGQRSFLRKVSFQGNHAFDDKTLFEYLVGGTQERLAKASAGVPFVQGDIQTGVDRVRGFYQSEGYLDAVIDDAVFTYSADHTHVDVLVKINEGPRYTFGAV